MYFGGLTFRGMIESGSGVFPGPSDVRCRGVVVRPMSRRVGRNTKGSPANADRISHSHNCTSRENVEWEDRNMHMDRGWNER
jgi:hypothetical protein